MTSCFSSHRSTLMMAGFSAAGAVAGGFLLWRLRSHRRKYMDHFEICEGKPDEASMKQSSTRSDIREVLQSGDFCPKIEHQLVETLIDLVQSLQSSQLESPSATPSLESATKLSGLLREYRRGLADQVWLEAREGKLKAVSDALACTIAAIRSREPPIEEAHIPELESCTRELSLILQGGRRGRGNTGRDFVGNVSTSAQSSQSQAGAGGGIKKLETPSNAKPSSDTGSKSAGSGQGCNGAKKSSSCDGCSGNGCGKSAPPDVKRLLSECRTQEQRWALRDKLIEYEINSLMAASPNLVMIPESRKAEIRRKVEKALDDAAESIHKDMISPGGGRSTNLAGTLMVGEDGSLTISSTDNFYDSD